MEQISSYVGGRSMPAGGTAHLGGAEPFQGLVFGVQDIEHQSEQVPGSLRHGGKKNREICLAGVTAGSHTTASVLGKRWCGSGEFASCLAGRRAESGIGIAVAARMLLTR